MNVPPRPEPDASRGLDPGRRDSPPEKANPADGPRHDNAAAEKPDNADTDPLLPSLNPYGPGWGAGWGSSWGDSPQADTPPGRPEEAERRESAKVTDRLVMGDVELPSAPEPFAFPTAAPRSSWSASGRTVLLSVGALAAVGGLILWLMNRSSGPATDVSDSASTTTVTTTTTTTTTEAPRRDAGAESQLMRSLPPGFSPGSCNAVDPAPGTVAMFNCDNNSDPGGPTSASFSLAGDRAALDAALTAAVPPGAVVICPGNIQSPGPWRHNATPSQVSGTLVCGMQGDVPIVAWTDVERLQVGVVRSDPPGPPLDQLYQWWSTHS